MHSPTFDFLHTQVKRYESGQILTTYLGVIHVYR